MKSLRGGARNIGTALQFVSPKMHVHTGHAKLGSLVNKLTSTCTSGHSATAYLRDCSTTNTSSVEVSLTTEPSVNRPQCQYKEALVHLLFTSKVLISLIPEILSMFDAGVNFLNCVRGVFNKFDLLFPLSAFVSFSLLVRVQRHVNLVNWRLKQFRKLFGIWWIRKRCDCQRFAIVLFN